MIDIYTSIGTTLTTYETNKQIPQSKFNKQNIKTRVIWSINVYIEMSINRQIRKRRGNDLKAVPKISATPITSKWLVTALSNPHNS